jgi:hypothetical protein
VADPGAGYVRINDADVSAADVIALDDVGLDAVDYSSLFSGLDGYVDSAPVVLTVTKKDDPTKFVSFYCDIVSDGSGYWHFGATGTIAFSDTAPFADDDDVYVQIGLVGPQGQTGETGATGATGAAGADGVAALTE